MMTPSRLRRTMSAAVLALLMLTTVGAARAWAVSTDDWTQWTVTSGPTDPTGGLRNFTFPLGGATMFAGSPGDGVLRSTNAGLTWSQENSGLTNDEAYYVRSTQGAPPLWLANGNGLFTSTDGTSWSPVGQGPGDNKLDDPVNDVYAISASDLVAGTSSDGIYTSTDGGSTWKESSGLPPSTTLFELTGTGPGTPIYASTSDGVYVSLDQGNSWTDESDGLPFGEDYRTAVVPGNPSELYTTVFGDGVYYSSNAGVTWTEANGSGEAVTDGLGVVGELAGGATQVEDFVLAPLGGGRLIIATHAGLFGTIDGGASWSAVNQAKNPTPVSADNMPMDQENIMGLGIGPNYLIAGTQGHGAWSLPFNPLSSNVAPSISPTSSGTVKVGAQLTVSAGTYHGLLPAIPSFEWKSSTSSNCAGATAIKNASTNAYEFGQSFTPDESLAGKYIDATVSVLGLKSTSSLTQTTTCEKVVANPNPNNAPYLQNSNTDGPVISPEDPAGYTPWGTTYSVTHGTWSTLGTHTTFTYTYQWLRCDSGACATIPGATTNQYTSTHQDVNETLEVLVTAANSDGSDTVAAQLSTSIIEKPPVPDPNNPPKIMGNPYIGQTLTSSVGDWSGYGIDYDRTWEACDPDGSDCSPFASGSTQGSTQSDDTTASSVTLTEAQRGEVIKLVVVAHNRPGSGSNTEADSAVTAVVGDAPVPGGGSSSGAPSGGTSSGGSSAGGSGSSGGSGSGGTKVTSPALKQPPVPALSKLSLVASRTKFTATLKYTVSIASTVKIEVERASAGRISKKKCVKATSKLAHAKKCTLYTVLETLTHKSKKGANSLAFSGKIKGRVLGLGSYRLVFVATAAGKHSTAKTVSFSVVKQ